MRHFWYTVSHSKLDRSFPYLIGSANDRDNQNKDKENLEMLPLTHVLRQALGALGRDAAATHRCVFVGGGWCCFCFSFVSWTCSISK